MNNSKIFFFVLIGLFSIGYFVIANKISKEFDFDFESTLYENKITAIEMQAANYGKFKTEIFSEGDSVYMTVEQLAENQAILYDGNGVVLDPRDNETSLNDLKVKITNSSEGVKAEVLG